MQKFATVVAKCRCRNAGQDAIFGEGMRLHNAMGKPTTGATHHCTVCGAVRKFGDDDKRKEILAKA